MYNAHSILIFPFFFLHSLTYIAPPNIVYIKRHGKNHRSSYSMALIQKIRTLIIQIDKDIER